MKVPLVVGRRPELLEGWHAVRLKDVCDYVNRGVAPEYAEVDTGVVAFSQRCVLAEGRVDISLGRSMVNRDEGFGGARLTSGDIVVNSTGKGTLGRTGIIEPADVKDAPIAVADGHVTVVRTNDQRILPEFLAFLFGTDVFMRFVNECLAVGSTNQTELGRDALRSLGFSVPSLSEQRQIISFLKNATDRIDTLVAEELRLLALTNERAHSTQRQLATEGCRPTHLRNVKESWLGHVPQHWPIVRLKYEARLESGHTPSRTQPELWTDCTIPWISLNDVGQLTTHEYISETVNMISEAGLNASSARILPAGTVVVSRDATIGRSSIMAIPMATSQHFADWVCGPKLEPRYLWLLFTTAMQDYFDSLTDGATLRTIGMPDIRALTIPLPPLAEQHEIIAEAQAVRVAGEKLSEELSVQIGLLQERRQALIASAVTEQLGLTASAA